MPDVSGCRLLDLSRRQTAVAVGLALVVVAPFVVAVFQARADGWYPVADNATMLNVARQVFTEHTPLVGEVSSATRYGVLAFHPSPLVYYVLAPFVEAFGNITGMLLGAAFTSVAALLLTGYVVLRTAGPLAAAWAWVAALVMCWSVGGTAFVYPPFKTTAALLVIVLFLHTCAALVAGRGTLLPLWVLAGSYPAAATMRYLLPVAAVGGTTVLIVLVQRWRRAGLDPVSRASLRGRIDDVLTFGPAGRRSLWLAAGVAVVGWWAPVYEAVIHGGGNVAELIEGSRAAAESSDGLRRAAGEQARALLLDPAMTAEDHLADAWGQIGLVLLVLAGLAWLVVRHRDRLSRADGAVVVVAAAALGFMLVSLATIPADEGIGAYRTLGAVPVAGYALFAAGVIVARTLRPQLVLPPAAARAAVVAAVPLAAVAVSVPGPIDDDIDPVWAFDATRELVEQVEPHLESEGEWRPWLIGGRTTPTVFVGLTGGLGAEGIHLGVRTRAPGLGEPEGGIVRPMAGDLVLMPSFLPGPEGEGWRRIAAYEPTGRSEEEAAATADELLAFARATDPEVTEVFAESVPRLLCPELATESYQGDCPEADDVLAADNPLAELPAGVVALTYLVQFGDTSVPILVGEQPPDELLEAAERTWEDIPLSVYVLPAG
jgi:hypothetical protein